MANSKFNRQVFKRYVDSFGDKKDIINRAYQITRKDDTTKNVSLTLYDIDNVIKYYFDNVIKPTVFSNDEQIKVNLIYGNQERWKSAQRDGFYRDDRGKIQTPLIMYKRISMQKNQTIPVDKMNRNIVYTWQRKWNERNRYTQFSTQYNAKPSEELYNIAIPDYFLLNYDFIVWTDFTEQLNSIIEKIIYNEGFYWGDANRFKFRATIDNYDNAIEVPTDEDRIVRCNFQLQLKGYLIPAEVNNQVNMQKSFTKSRIVIKGEVDKAFTTLNIKQSVAKPPEIKTYENKNVTVLSTLQSYVTALTATLTASMDPALKAYLNQTISKKSRRFVTATGSGLSLSIFPGVTTMSAPVGQGVSNPTKENFIYFINGQQIEHDGITIEQKDKDFYLYINTGSVGLSFNDNDEVTAWGKFNTTITAPSTNPSSMSFSDVTPSASFVDWFHTELVNGYILLRSTGSSPDTPPTQDVIYTAGETIGNALVRYVGPNKTYRDTFTSGTTYYYSVYSFNGNY